MWDNHKVTSVLVNFVCFPDKDVTRTDRTHPFFEGEDNPNITVLHDILLTHCMYDFDLGMFFFSSYSLDPWCLIFYFFKRYLRITHRTDVPQGVLLYDIS